MNIIPKHAAVYASAFLFMIVCALTCVAHTPDTIQTSGGPLSILPISHATFTLTWKGKTIYIDPSADAKVLEGLPAPDLVLITDIHGDHFNIQTLRALDVRKAKLVVPQAVADKLPPELKSTATILDNGETSSLLGIDIKAIPMYNLPESKDAMHTKGRGNGYILTFGNKNVYISGDTGGIPEMRALKNIDVAFVCMNLPYTMDVDEAASAVLDFKPKVVYPYHYRGKNGLTDTGKFKQIVNKGNSSIDVRLRDWYEH